MDLKTEPTLRNLPAVPSVRKRRPWWFYGALTGGALLLVGAGAVLAVSLYAGLLIVRYTATAPQLITQAHVSGADRDALSRKWGAFYADLSAERPAAPLAMSPKELNVFASMMPALKDRVHVTIVGNKLRVEFSMPLEAVGNKVPPPLLKGRYANGVAWLNLCLGEDGFPRFDLISLELNGRRFPNWIRPHLQGDRNLQAVLRTMHNDTLLSHLQSIDIRDGLLVFTPTTPE